MHNVCKLNKEENFNVILLMVSLMEMHQLDIFQIVFSKNCFKALHVSPITYSRTRSAYILFFSLNIHEINVTMGLVKFELKKLLFLKEIENTLARPIL